jgi:hypothetical protein
MDGQAGTSWFSTLPRTIAAVTALLTALASAVTGIYVAVHNSGTAEPPGLISAGMSSPASSSMALTLPEGPKSEGWAVVGKYLGGKLSNPLIKVQLAMPQVGDTCEALDDFSVFKEDPRDKSGGGRILLGDVRKGDTIEVLDMWRPDGKGKGAPLYVKLRAVLHPH